MWAKVRGNSAKGRQSSVTVKAVHAGEKFAPVLLAKWRKWSKYQPVEHTELTLESTHVTCPFRARSREAFEESVFGVCWR
jgi:hypothetical protein